MENIKIDFLAKREQLEAKGQKSVIIDILYQNSIFIWKT